MAEDMNVSKSQGTNNAAPEANNKQDQSQKFDQSMKGAGTNCNDNKSGLSMQNNAANENKDTQGANAAEDPNFVKGKEQSKTDYKQGDDYKSLSEANKGFVDKYMDTLNEAASSQGPMNEDQKQGANARGNWISAVAKNAQEAGITLSDGTTPQEYKAVMDKVQSTSGESQRLSGLQDDYTNKLQNSLNGTEAEDRVRNVADGHVEFGTTMANGKLTTLNEDGNNNKTVADAATDLDYMTKTGKFANNFSLAA